MAFDAGVAAHVCVGFGSGHVAVGPVSPVAVLKCREQGTLRSWVQWFASYDEAGACGPLTRIDEVGEVRYPSPRFGLVCVPAGGLLRLRVNVGFGRCCRCWGFMLREFLGLRNCHSW